MPIIAATSKFCRVVMKFSRKTAAMAGAASGSVTRRMICRGLAPQVLADSSRAGSIARSSGVMSRKLSGTATRPSTRTMPVSV